MVAFYLCCHTAATFGCFLERKHRYLIARNSFQFANRFCMSFCYLALVFIPVKVVIAAWMTNVGDFHPISECSSMNFVGCEEYHFAYCQYRLRYCCNSFSSWWWNSFSIWTLGVTTYVIDEFYGDHLIDAGTRELAPVEIVLLFSSWRKRKFCFYLGIICIWLNITVIIHLVNEKR